MRFHITVRTITFKWLPNKHKGYTYYYCHYNLRQVLLTTAFMPQPFRIKGMVRSADEESRASSPQAYPDSLATLGASISESTFATVSRSFSVRRVRIWYRLSRESP